MLRTAGMPHDTPPYDWTCGVTDAALTARGGVTLPVSVRRLRTHLDAQPRLRWWLRDHGARLMRLNHRNILTIVACNTDCEEPYVITERVVGLTLDEFMTLTRGVVAPELVALIGIAVAAAGSYLHVGRGNPGHRPLYLGCVNLEDVLVGTAGEIKLRDSAFLRSHAIRRISLIGRAPELTRGEVGPRTDVYAVAALMLALGGGPARMAATWLGDILAKATSDAPDDRPADLATFIALIRAHGNPAHEDRLATEVQALREETIPTEPKQPPRGGQPTLAWVPGLSPCDDRARDVAAPLAPTVLMRPAAPAPGDAAPTAGPPSPPGDAHRSTVQMLAPSVLPSIAPLAAPREPVPMWRVCGAPPQALRGGDLHRSIAALVALLVVSTGLALWIAFAP